MLKKHIATSSRDLPIICVLRDCVMQFTMVRKCVSCFSSDCKKRQEQNAPLPSNMTMDLHKLNIGKYSRSYSYHPQKLSILNHNLVLKQTLKNILRLAIYSASPKTQKHYMKVITLGRNLRSKHMLRLNHIIKKRS